MASIDSHGHHWPASDPAYYDVSSGEVVFTGYQATGDEPCDYCGMRYRDYSLTVQAGSPEVCGKSRRVIDGITIIGPET